MVSVGGFKYKCRRAAEFRTRDEEAESIKACATNARTRVERYAEGKLRADGMSGASQRSAVKVFGVWGGRCPIVLSSRRGGDRIGQAVSSQTRGKQQV